MKSIPTRAALLAPKASPPPQDTPLFFTVALNKKYLYRYDVETNTFHTRYKIVYMDIIQAINLGQAVYAAFYNYFVWRLTLSRQLRHRSLSAYELIDVEIDAQQLADSAMEQLGNLEQKIFPLSSPWDLSETFKLSFEK